jgi:hypothetical protein
MENQSAELAEHMIRGAEARRQAAEQARLQATRASIRASVFQLAAARQRLIKIIGRRDGLATSRDTCASGGPRSPP